MVMRAFVWTLIRGFSESCHMWRDIGAAALAVHNAVVERDPSANVRAMDAACRRVLQQRFGDRRHVGDRRDCGPSPAIESVADRPGKEAFDAARKLHAGVEYEAFTHGLIVYSGSGTANRVSGDQVLVAPPFIAESHHMETIVARLGPAVDAAIADGKA